MAIDLRLASLFLLVLLQASGSLLDDDLHLFEGKDGFKQPITKVVKLLTDMKATLEAEATEDQKLHADMESWCSSNIKENEQIAADSTTSISEGEATIAENVAKGNRLHDELRALSAEVNKNQATIDTAAAIREKQHEKFLNDTEKVRNALDAVKRAENMIGGGSVQATKFLQSGSSVKAIAEALRAVKHVFGHKVKSMASKAEWMEFNDFIEDPQNFLDLRKDRKVALIQHGNPGGTASALDGILSAMIDDFTNEIHDEVQDDEKNEKSFKELKTAMGSQISAAKIQIDEKTVQKATAAQKVTDATTSVSAAKNALAEAQAYLKTLNSKCAESATAFESRTKLRTEEQSSVAKAIEILGNEKTKKLEKKTLAFLQLSSQSSARRMMNHATEALKSAGKRLKADELVTLAAQLRGASLAKVVQAIAKMMEDLKKEATDEVKKRDSCTDDLNSNDLAQKEKQRVLQDVSGKISVLQTNLDQVAADQKALKTRVTELQAQIGNTTATRKKETSDFFAFMDDQKATQVILAQAIEALKGVYQPAEKATLVEVSEHRSEVDEDAAPVEKTYNPNSGGAGVVTLLSQIIEDSKTLQTKAKKDEADAEATFETALNDLNAAVATAQKDFNEKVSKEASLKSEVTQSKQTKQATSDAIDQLTATNMALHEDCDFLLNNFAVRQKAREDELDALSSAKALLGSSPAASETDTTAPVSDDE